MLRLLSLSSYERFSPNWGRAGIICFVSLENVADSGPVGLVLVWSNWCPLLLWTENSLGTNTITNLTAKTAAVAAGIANDGAKTPEMVAAVVAATEV